VSLGHSSRLHAGNCRYVCGNAAGGAGRRCGRGRAPAATARSRPSFHAVNRSKQDITLDLSSPTDRDRARSGGEGGRPSRRRFTAEAAPLGIDCTTLSPLTAAGLCSFPLRVEGAIAGFRPTTIWLRLCRASAATSSPITVLRSSSSRRSCLRHSNPHCRRSGIDLYGRHARAATFVEISGLSGIRRLLCRLRGYACDGRRSVRDRNPTPNASPPTTSIVAPTTAGDLERSPPPSWSRCSCRRRDLLADPR
jgi:hypothetical protein